MRFCRLAQERERERERDVALLTVTYPDAVSELTSGAVEPDLIWAPVIEFYRLILRLRKRHSNGTNSTECQVVGMCMMTAALGSS